MGSYNFQNVINGDWLQKEDIDQVDNLYIIKKEFVLSKEIAVNLMF